MVLEEALKYGKEALEKAGIPNAEIDAFWIFEHVFEVNKTDYLLGRSERADDEKFSVYQKLIERRAQHEPCQYILGKCNFCGIDLLVNENVLIPRQDTEVLVEQVLNIMPRGAKILDMCTGSGAIAIAIKTLRSDAEVTGSDISEKALEVAEENVKSCGVDVKLIQGDLFENIDREERFDLIVSNPPYVTNLEYEELMPEVKEHEPRLALTAGDDGLDIYKRLVKEAPEYLKEDGIIAMEIGCAQGKAVEELLKSNGFGKTKVVKDLAGLDRVVVGWLNE